MIDGKYMGSPFSLAMPMVALNFLAFWRASAVWVKMPLGK
jgi:hypothetical protein